MKKKYYSSDKRCIVTGFSPVDLHHVKTRGSGGTDDAWNLMPLAHALHVDVHAIGLTAFAERYPEATNWLKDNGWILCELRKKWVR